jgi:polysaccharide export outer membrane protein
MGVDISGFEQHDVPTIYRANFRKPDSFFMAKNFKLRDGDVVYVSNADSVAVSKFFGLATSVTGNTVQLDGDLTTLRN